MLFPHNRVPKQTSYVEVRKSPNLCCAIRSFFCFYHARFYRFVTPSFTVYRSSAHPGQRFVLKIHPFQYDQAHPSSFELKHQDHLNGVRFQPPLSAVEPVIRIPSTHGGLKSYAVIGSHLDFAGRFQGFDKPQRSVHRSIQYGQLNFLLTCSALQLVRKVQSPSQGRVTLRRHTVMNGQQSRILQLPPWPTAKSTAYGMPTRQQRHGGSFSPLGT